MQSQTSGGIPREVNLVRLPSRVSTGIDEAIRKFMGVTLQSTNAPPMPYLEVADGKRGLMRYHDADLWMILKDEVDQQQVAIVTRRLTIAVYSDAPDELTMIPDIVVTQSGGRYILQPQIRQTYAEKKSVPLDEIRDSAKLAERLNDARNFAMEISVPKLETMQLLP